MSADPVSSALGRRRSRAGTVLAASLAGSRRRAAGPGGTQWIGQDQPAARHPGAAQTSTAAASRLATRFFSTSRSMASTLPTEERHLAYLPQDFGLFPAPDRGRKRGLRTRVRLGAHQQKAAAQPSHGVARSLRSRQPGQPKPGTAFRWRAPAHRPGPRPGLVAQGAPPRRADGLARRRGPRRGARVPGRIHPLARLAHHPGHPRHHGCRSARRTRGRARKGPRRGLRIAWPTSASPRPRPSPASSCRRAHPRASSRFPSPSPTDNSVTTEVGGLCHVIVSRSQVPTCPHRTRSAGRLVHSARMWQRFGDQTAIDAGTNVAKDAPTVADLAAPGVDVAVADTVLKKDDVPVSPVDTAQIDIVESRSPCRPRHRHGHSRRRGSSDGRRASTVPPCPRVRRLVNPLYIMSGDTQVPVLKTLGKALRQGPNPVTLVWYATGSCTIIDALYNGTPLKQVPSYIPDDPSWDPSTGTVPSCALESAGHSIDIGIPIVFPEACAPSTTPPADLVAFKGPVQSMIFVVPHSASPEAISSAQAKLVFGQGTAGNVAPWTRPDLLFRSAAHQGHASQPRCLDRLAGGAVARSTDQPLARCGDQGGDLDFTGKDHRHPWQRDPR
jgi:hypothetical protein